MATIYLATFVPPTYVEDSVTFAAYTSYEAAEQRCNEEWVFECRRADAAVDRKKRYLYAVTEVELFGLLEDLIDR